MISQKIKQIKGKKPAATQLHIDVALDAEWDAANNDTPICFQSAIRFSGSSNVFSTICWNKNIERLPPAEHVFDLVQQTDFDEGVDHLSNTIREFISIKKGVNALENCKIRVNLLIFYSAQDLNIAFGFEKLKQIYISPPNFRGIPFLDSKRNIYGHFSSKKSETNTGIFYKISDLSGWTNSSLQELASSVNVPLPEKTLGKAYGPKMMEFLQNHPETFLEYAKRDVTGLLEIYDNKINQVNTISTEVLKTQTVYTPKTIPLTSGKLVTNLFESWLKQKGGFPLELALRKLGMLEPKSSADAHNKIQELHQKLFYSAKSPEEEYRSNPEKYQRLFNPSSYRFLAYSNASVGSFLQTDYRCKAHVGALVVGGRANNEQPDKFTASLVGDLDIEGAYGNALAGFDFPIGNPEIYTSSFNQKPLTLGEFLKKYRSELVDNLYTIYVSGNLSFSQDLLYSKNVSNEHLERQAQKFSKISNFQKASEKTFGSEDRDDTSHIRGDMVLARRELKNAVITSDLLEVIEKVCTNTELKSLYETTVDVAVFYAAKNFVSSVDQWSDEVLKDKGDLSYDFSKQAVLDTRTKKWTKIPLENFVGELLKERKKYQKLEKSASDETRRAGYYAHQASLKLIINTLYGCLASPYFSIGNTVVANNITARCRRGAWQMVKALNFIQTITDGGLYAMNEVLFLEPEKYGGRKPGLSTLSDYRKLKAHRSIRVASLANINWEPYFLPNFDKEKFSNAAELALLHIEKYFSHYDLGFPYKIEHKNFAKNIVYLNKADYAYYAPDEKGNYTIKIAKLRGHKFMEDETSHPHFITFERLLAGDPDVQILNLAYVNKHLASIREFKHHHSKKDIETNNFKFKPGEELRQNREAKFNNTQFPIETIDEHERRAKRKGETFEKYGEHGLIKIYEMMEQDNLRGIYQKKTQDALKELVQMKKRPHSKENLK